jgi:hypothetical protein
MRFLSFIQTTSLLFFYPAGAVAENLPGAINIPFSQAWYVFMLIELLISCFFTSQQPFANLV